MIDNKSPSLSEAKRALLQQRIRGRDAAAPRPRVAAATRTSRSPLSVAQEQLWFFSQLAPDNPVYNESITIRKRGTFDIGVFRSAFNELVGRHDVWHCTFESDGGDRGQAVSSAPVYDLPVLDLSGLPMVEAEQEATRPAGGATARPYALRRGPLLRPTLVRFADDDHRLYLALHHLIFDGGSLSRTVLPELIALYDGFAGGGTSPLGSDPVQYADYAAWEREWVEGAEFARRLEYWKRHLDGAPNLVLPLDNARPARQRFRGGTEPMHIDVRTVQQLRDLSQHNRVSLFQTLASVFATLLHRYSGQDDVVFGTVTDLRQRSQHEHVVGYCVTPLVLRVDVADDPTLTQLLSRVRNDTLDALDNKVPFERLVREIHPAREAGTNPICQALLVLEPSGDVTDTAWSLDLTGTTVDDAIGHAKFDLAIELDERPDGDIAGRLIFNADVLDRQTVRRIIGHWDRLLEAVIADPARPISELPMLSELELHQQVVEWNATAHAFPRDSCVHHLIADQAARTPDAVAVTSSRGTVTFAELDDQAARLAAHLRACGVGTDVLVGICMDRSVDMMVALLAVLKAGGAYVPLDPAFPPDRIAFMLADSELPVLLRQRAVMEQLPEVAATAWCLDEIRDELDAEPADGLDEAVGGQDLAYVIYTSGSTGRPKGVEIPHRALEIG